MYLQSSSFVSTAFASGMYRIHHCTENMALEWLLKSCARCTPLSRQMRKKRATIPPGFPADPVVGVSLALGGSNKVCCRTAVAQAGVFGPANLPLPHVFLWSLLGVRGRRTNALQYVLTTVPRYDLEISFNVLKGSFLVLSVISTDTRDYALRDISRELCG